jgi:hypothetical protein
MPSGLETTNVLTPEERLKKYKELLNKLTVEKARRAQEEAQTLNGGSEGNSVGKSTLKEELSETSLRMSAVGSVPSEPVSNAVAAQRTEPSKLLGSQGQIITSMKTVPVSSSEGKNRILLKVKQKSIDSEIEEVRRQREDLERRFEKGRINKDEYEHELEELIKRGQTLLVRKTEVCKELETVGQK